jgi:nitrogen-specific signal transduction histidine kinase
MGTMLATHFAPPGREDEAVLSRQQEALLADPMVDRLLDSFPEPTMILNSKRQIVRVNERTRALLGTSQDEILGKRTGEAIGCPHAEDKPDGCGTTLFCKHCGAARAIVNCMANGVTDVQECRLEGRLKGAPVALDLRVSAAPFSCRGEEFTVFALRDITDEKRREVLERVFFHDILNSAGGLHGIARCLDQLHGSDEKELKQAIQDLSGQIVEEIQSQRDLLAAEAGHLAVTILDVHVTELMERVCTIYRRHSVGYGKNLVVDPVEGQPVIWTDSVLLGRVLGNLIKNALEATRRGQTVTLAFENKKQPIFSVHNPDVMPEHVQLQMFQRSFSTKEGRGRGIGSYSVKLLTEKYLQGSVSFVSREGQGTTFFVSLPPPSEDVRSRAFVYHP